VLDFGWGGGGSVIIIYRVTVPLKQYEYCMPLELLGGGGGHSALEVSWRAPVGLARLSQEVVLTGLTFLHQCAIKVPYGFLHNGVSV